MSGLAITALILGIGAFPTMGVTALPAIGLGVGAIIKATDSGSRGKVMALLGIVAGGLAIPLLLFLLGVLSTPPPI